jgi:hypothetical protein
MKDDKWEKIWKEAAVTYLRYFRDIEGTTNTFSPDHRSPYTDSNKVPPKYMSRLLPIG